MPNFFETALGGALIRGASAALPGILAPVISQLPPSVQGAATSFVGGLSPPGAAPGGSGIATQPAQTPTGPPVLPFQPSSIQAAGLFSGPFGGTLSPGEQAAFSRLAAQQPGFQQARFNGVSSPPGAPNIIGVNGAKVIGRVISTKGNFVKKVLRWPSMRDSAGCLKRGKIFGAGIFNVAGQLIGTDPTWRPSKRMNVLNPSALKRSMRRLSGFQCVIQDAVGMIESMCPSKTTRRRSSHRGKTCHFCRTSPCRCRRRGKK